MKNRFGELTGWGIVGGTIAFLANVGGARDTLTNLWPVVAPWSPVIASSLLLVGLALVANALWRGHVQRRGERFRRLEPKIEKHSRWLRNPATGRGFVEDRLRTATALEPFNVGLPQDRVDVLLLLDLVRQGKLRTARKKYPLTEAKKDELRAMERGLRGGHATPR